MSIKQNIGKIDSWVRVILGATIIVIGIYLQSWVWGIIGLLISITGITRYCFLYRLFGISTCKIEESNKKD